MRLLLKSSRYLFCALCLLSILHGSAIAKKDKDKNKTNNIKSAKLAIVDLGVVFSGYSAVQKAQTEIMSLEEKLQRLIASSESELNEINKKGDKEALDKKQSEVQAIVDKEFMALQEKKLQYNDTINKKINDTILSIAKEKAYSLILDKSVVFSSAADDISSEVLTRLEKVEK